MRLCTVYFTAAIVLLSVLITALAVTTRPPAPLRCTFCGAIAGEPKVSSEPGNVVSLYDVLTRLLWPRSPGFFLGGCDRDLARAVATLHAATSSSSSTRRE